MKIRKPIRKFNLSLILFILVRAFIPQHSPAVEALPIMKYEDAILSFYYPSDWEVEVCRREKIEIRLRPKNWFQINKSSEYRVDDFALYISLSQNNFKRVAESIGFVMKGSKWTLEGRRGAEGEIEEIKGNNWKGLLGEAPIGTFYKNGGYAGLGFALTAIITDGKTSVVINGESLSTKDGKDILKSIDFASKK
jgi:hypothetical protein